jgi:hypothetical protein
MARVPSRIRLATGFVFAGGAGVSEPFAAEPARGLVAGDGVDPPSGVAVAAAAGEVGVEVGVGAAATGAGVFAGGGVSGGGVLGGGVDGGGVGGGAPPP